jgi:predicted dithiol-disulfide oxidoreductase (DUF899 family)
MFGPDYSARCPACSAIADGFDGFVVHLANHDVMLWAVSRAPLAKPVPEPDAQLAAMCGTDGPTYSRDRLGMSAFVLEDGVVYHTYSTYGRGVDGLGACTSGSIALQGAQRDGPWWRRHDEYDKR